MAQEDLNESFLTVAEVAKALKLNQQTVRNWIDQGSLPAVRVGRRVRIKRSDFERIVDEGYSGAASVSQQSTTESAQDFWEGGLVGLAEPERAAGERDRPDPPASP